VTVPLRREPPRFQPVTATRVEAVSPRLQRVTLSGLQNFSVDEPAASVRLLLPVADELVMPAWNGNEFLLPDGSRPAIRTLTPRFLRDGELDVDIVVHDQGVLREWVREGAEGAISGPGRGYTIDYDAPGYVLAGDETAIPAISQLLELLSPMPVKAFVEARPDARHDLPVTWCESFVEAVRAARVRDERVWVAGEAAAVQRVRKHLFEERGLPRAQATVRGYWKQGRAESD
jgi:NADPH-dependent ferric siderophore reductase